MNKAMRWLGLISIFIWGTHATSGKFILSSGSSPWVLAGLRLWIAAAGVGLAAWIARRRSPRAAALKMRHDRDFWISFGLGFLPNILFFHFALMYGLAGSTMILENTAPLFVLLLGLVFLRRRPNLKSVAAVGLAVAGVLLIFFKDAGTVPRAAWGSVFGVLAGLTWAVFSNWSEKAFDQSTDLASRLEYLARLMFYGAIAMTPALLTQPILYTYEQWLVILYYAIAPTAIAFVLWNEVVNSISALSATIFFNLTIPVTLLFAWLTIGERPSVVHLLAALLVTSAVIVDVLPARKSASDHI